MERRNKILDIAHKLDIGVIDISEVDPNMHRELLIPLAIARKEAEIGRRKDHYQHLSNIIWSLQLTPVMPKREEFCFSGQTTPRSARGSGTGTIPLIDVFRGVSNEEVGLLRRRESELEAAERFWRREEERTLRLKEKEFGKLSKKVGKITIPNDPVKAAKLRESISHERNCLKKRWMSRISEMEMERNDDLMFCTRQIRTLNRSLARPLRTPRRRNENERRQYADSP
jgi:hypothetical protein